MAEVEPVDQLLRRAEAAVQETLGYLEGPGAASSVRIARWGVKEVAAHLLYWHQVTLEAAVAVGRGEPALRFTAAVDDLNEGAVASSRGMSLAEIVDQLKGAHRDLVVAMRELPDPDAVLMHRFDGSTPCARDRLRTIANHWTGHLNQLRAAAG